MTLTRFACLLLLIRTAATSTPYEKIYIILVGGNQIAIPEELLQAQRRRFR